MRGTSTPSSAGATTSAPHNTTDSSSAILHMSLYYRSSQNLNSMPLTRGFLLRTNGSNRSCLQAMAARKLFSMSHRHCQANCPSLRTQHFKTSQMRTPYTFLLTRLTLESIMKQSMKGEREASARGAPAKTGGSIEDGLNRILLDYGRGIYIVACSYLVRSRFSRLHTSAVDYERMKRSCTYEKDLICRSRSPSPRSLPFSPRLCDLRIVR